MTINAIVIVQLLLVFGGLMPCLVAADEFCDNLKLVTSTLPMNTSSSPVHFTTTAVGQVPNVAYALALCRGDVTSDTACSDCVANTLEKLKPPVDQQQCYRSRWYLGEPCVVIFSDHNFLVPFNATEYVTPPFERWNEKNISGDDADFIAGLVHDLLIETAQRAAAGSAVGKRFATGVMDSGRTFPLVYSLAQCTPDLSDGDCLACLNRTVGMINSTMSLRMGGMIQVIRCYFRYETYVFYDGGPMVRLGPPGAPPTTTIKATHKRRMSKLWVIPMVAVPLVAAACFCFIFYSCWLRKGKRRGRAQGSQDELETWGLEGNNSEFSVFDFDQILEATSNFSEENKLGQGGFGAVYKGQISVGLDVAVKRLASHSGQGFIEFKNEVQVIAKLQHRNLVRLLGCCSQGEEKILVYEYLPNKSLDFFIFDENKRALLDWYKLLRIIEGVAHGLLYLHKHSRLRVIHRDLKPSNILLDSDMNPKISDFGLAKIFSSNNTQGNTTRRVVGTYGYMAPEYASDGIFSIKSDVFSFGVLMLEIISGKRNSGRHQCGDFINLLGYAWQLWEEGRGIELIDASVLPMSHLAELTRFINIALLCVQENVADRPTMSDVVAMLSSETMVLVKPKHPAYFHARAANEEEFGPSSINDVTISVLSAR